MEYRDWSILQILFQEKNITRAAQRLYLSQPALTKRLRQIEKEFGVQIVHRGRRGVHFTPQGEYLAICADEMLIKLGKIKEHVANMGEKVNGTLRLGVSSYFARYQLPNLLKHFSAAYPDVEFKVITGFSKDVYKSVYNQDVHVGFVRGNYSWAEQKLLLFEETICVVSKKPFSLQDLPSMPRIDFETDPLLLTLVENWWASRYSQPPLIGMTVDKADTCREMVVSGLGYGILPRLMLKNTDDLYLHEIEDLAGNPIKRQTWMFYHQDSLELKMVAAFVRFMEEWTQKQPQ